MGQVLWKPLYYISIAMFIVALILYPVDQRWAMIATFFIIGLWSQVPGIISLPLTKMGIHDFFAFIIAVGLSPMIAGIYFAAVMVATKIVGPQKWTPYIVKNGITGFLTTAYALPIILQITPNLIHALWIYMAVHYVMYYGSVYFFERHEFAFEMALLPSIVFFDVIGNTLLVSLFGNTMTQLLTEGILTGGVFMIFVGVILGYAVISRNAKTIGSLIKKDVPLPSAEKPKEHKRIDYYKLMSGEKDYVHEEQSKKGRRAKSKEPLAGMVKKLKNR